MAASRAVPDSYHFTVVYDGCLSGEDKTDSIKLSFEFVEILRVKAEKQGILCFLPHLMLAGKMELRELYSAVQNSDHVILVMTEGYLGKMCRKKQPDSQNDPDLMLQQIHYNIIDYKISDNADGIIVVPIYLQTHKKEISLGAYRSIQFRKKEDWEDEENWEKIWNLIPKDLQPSVLTGSAVSSQGSSEPDAGESAQNDSNQGVRSQETAAAVIETATDAISSMTENFSKMSSSETAENPQDSTQFESLTSDARVSAEETAGSSTADSKTDAHPKSQSTEDDSTASRVHHPGSPPCVNMDSSPNGARSLEASAVLTGSAVSSPGSSEPDAGKSDARLSAEAGSSTADSKTDALQRSESTEDDSTAIRLHNAGSPPCVNMDSSLNGARRTKSIDEKTENEGAASEMSRSQSEPACSQQQQEEKSIRKKLSDWFSQKFSRKQ